MIYPRNSSRLYLDHAASMPICNPAREAMISALDLIGNASAVHTAGRGTRKIIEQARESCAEYLACYPSEIIFTASGTESNNIALKGLFWSQKKKNPERNRILVSAVEHHAVLDAVQWLEQHEGAIVTVIPCDQAGRIETSHLLTAIGEHPENIALIAVMLANNETGSINNISELCAISREIGSYFHTDAVTAAGHYPIDFHAFGVTSLSISAHKFAGPQGVGALVMRRDAEPQPLIHGGGQERDIRSGTYNTAGIVGMVAALEYSLENFVTKHRLLWQLRALLLSKIIENISEVSFYGAAISANDPLAEWQLPGIVDLSFGGCEGDSLLMLLDAQGIECSHGAACSAGVASASHVLLAMRVDKVLARGALRFSFNEILTSEDIMRLTALLPDIVQRARLAGTVSKSISHSH